MNYDEVKRHVDAEVRNLNRLFNKRGAGVTAAFFDRRNVMYQMGVAPDIKADILTQMQATVEAQAYTWRKEWGYNYPVPVQVDLGKARLILPLFDRVPQITYLDEAYLDELATIGKKWHIMLGIAPPYAHPGNPRKSMPLYVHLDGPEFSILWTAVSQWGKTTAIKSSVMEMCWRHDPKELRLIIIDPENKTWGKWGDVPHVTDHVTGMDHATQVLSDIDSILQGPAGNYKTKTLLVIEEFQAFTLAAKGSVTRQQFQLVMSDLMTRGAAYGFSAIVTTQRPEMRVIPGMIRDNIPVRISGRQRSTGACQMALGQGYHQPLGLGQPGDFVVLNSWGLTQFYGLVLKDEAKLIAGLNRKYQPFFSGRPASHRYRDMDAEILSVLEQFDDGVGLRKGWKTSIAKVLARRAGYLTHRGQNWYILAPKAEKFADVYFMRAHPNDLPTIDEGEMYIEYDEPLRYEREKRLHVQGPREFEDLHSDDPLEDWDD